MIKKIAYKITTDDLTSSTEIGPAEIRYIVGKKVTRKRKYGALAVFDTLENAKNSRLVSRIFRCEYTPSKLKYLYNGVEKQNYLSHKGTIYAHSVTLLEEIKS